MFLFGPFSEARKEVTIPGILAWRVASCFLALLVPLLIVVVGLITELLGPGILTTKVQLGRGLVVPVPEVLIQQPALTQLLWLTAFAVGVAFVFALLLWRTHLGLLRRGRLTTEKFHQRILQRILDKAQVEGASAQRSRVQALIERDLPALNIGLISWWRSCPRIAIVLACCLGLALLVDVWLALLAIIGGILVWRLRMWVSRREPAQGAGWEVAHSQQDLVETVRQAPLLARLQSRQTVSDVFAEKLLRLRRQQAAVDAHHSRVLPVVAFAGLLATLLVLLAFGVNRLSSADGLGMSAGVVLGLSLAGAAVAAARILRFYKNIVLAQDAAANLYRFLAGEEDQQMGDLVGITGIRSAVELSNVTLRNDLGKDVLTSLTLRLEPKSVVALLGTDTVSTAALIEILQGFGKPTEGTVEIDGISVSEIHPNSLSRQVFWVGADGPIWNGTIAENLLGIDAVGGDEAVQEVLRRVGIYEQISELSDGMATVLSPDDTSLDGTTRYAIGVARALLRKPALVVVQEPDTVEGLADDEPLDALRFLAHSGAIVIMLPRRLNSLRTADRVVLLNGSRLAGEGSHEDLLAGSDLYRHLNYALFNPYRNL
ncbi:putative ABC transporter ATP-binding protein [Roseimaritima multifibrata]|uniref:Putative ABC transporter ATP-binding protein n=1 Tax=Roseimaritima multifibrata TaxID=1930274 RepID=A0A517ME28_9BACT|nr:ABC transporter ATP-binding protein [Roseimaritima multifibrata]QDS93140.1 putative ABC transporter ATP-binding protein [Roseimaritima multifibrata]